MHFTQTAHRMIVTLAGLAALVGALAGTPARAGDHDTLTVSNIGSSGDYSTPDKDSQPVLRREPTDPEPAKEKFERTKPHANAPTRPTSESPTAPR